MISEPIPRLGDHHATPSGHHPEREPMMVFARRTATIGGALGVLGIVGVARFWTMAMGALLLVFAGLVLLIASEERHHAARVDAEQPAPADVLATLPAPMTRPAPVPMAAAPSAPPLPRPDATPPVLVVRRTEAPSTRVSFRLPATGGAQRAVLVGDFNDWSTTRTPMRLDGGQFAVDLVLPVGRTYRFRYLVDGERWENDWAADRYVPNAFGTEDSVLDLSSSHRRHDRV